MKVHFPFSSCNYLYPGDAYGRTRLLPVTPAKIYGDASQTADKLTQPAICTWLMGGSSQFLDGSSPPKRSGTENLALLPLTYHGAPCVRSTFDTVWWIFDTLTRGSIKRLYRRKQRFHGRRRRHRQSGDIAHPISSGIHCRTPFVKQLKRVWLLTSVPLTVSY